MQLINFSEKEKMNKTTIILLIACFLFSCQRRLIVYKVQVDSVEEFITDVKKGELLDSVQSTFTNGIYRSYYAVEKDTFYRNFILLNDKVCEAKAGFRGLNLYNRIKLKRILKKDSTLSEELKTKLYDGVAHRINVYF